MAGAIDGTHLKIRKPAGDACHNAYFSREGFAIIAFPAIVDADELFQSMSV